MPNEHNYTILTFKPVPELTRNIETSFTVRNIMHNFKIFSKAEILDLTVCIDLDWKMPNVEHFSYVTVYSILRIVHHFLSYCDYT